MRRMLVLMAVLLTAGCQQKPQLSEDQAALNASAKRKPPPFRIVDVSANRDRIDINKKERVAVGYTIDAPATVVLHIYDGRDALIYRSEPSQVQSGTHTLEWDGRDHSGRLVPPEAYHYVLQAENANGTVVHDLTDTTGNEALLARDPVWDAASGQLRFRLDHPSRINVRFGLAEGPYVHTAVDWVARDAGDHAVAWDGWDTSRVMNLGRHGMLTPTVRAYTLPQNTVFVGRDADKVAFVEMRPLGRREKHLKPVKTRMFFHADQPLETRGDVPVELSIFGEAKRDAEGRHIVSGVVPIRLDVPQPARVVVMERRFEPVFFIDGIFVFETEVGVLPMTWHWDSTVVNPGEHFITVNVRGYEGNYGTATLRVWVEPSTPSGAVASPAMESSP
jgi:hypothetical protein